MDSKRLLQFVFTIPCFLLFFLFFYSHISSSLSISVTYLLHVVTIRLRNRKRGLCQRACCTYTRVFHPPLNQPFSLIEKATDYIMA